MRDYDFFHFVQRAEQRRASERSGFLFFNVADKFIAEVGSARELFSDPLKISTCPCQEDSFLSISPSKQGALERHNDDSAR